MKNERERGEAELRVSLIKGVIRAYHSDGTLLIKRIAKLGDWDKI